MERSTPHPPRSTEQRPPPPLSSSFSPSFLPHLIQSKFYQIADQFTNLRSPPSFPSNQASTTQLTSGPLHKGTHRPVNMSAEETANATAGATEVAPEDEGFRVSRSAMVHCHTRASEFKARRDHRADRVTGSHRKPLFQSYRGADQGVRQLCW